MYPQVCMCGVKIYFYLPAPLALIHHSTYMMHKGKESTAAQGQDSSQADSAIKGKRQ